MLWGMLGYPLALATRRPGAFAGLLLGSTLTLVAIDVVSSALGRDESPWSAAAELNGVYIFATSIVGLFVGGWATAHALIDLKERTPDRPPSMSDGAISWGVGLLFVVTALLPALIVGLAVLVGVHGLTPILLDAEDPPLWLAIGVATVFAIPLLYVLLRLSFAGQLSLSWGRAVLWRSWPETRGKALALFGLYVALLIVAAMMIALPVLGLYLAVTPKLPADNLAGALQPWVLAGFFAQEAAYSVLTIYSSAALVFIFARMRMRIVVAA